MPETGKISCQTNPQMEWGCHLQTPDFESTDWEMFQKAVGNDINEYTDSVICYINKCTKDVLSWCMDISQPEALDKTEKYASTWEHEPLLLTLVTS